MSDDEHTFDGGSSFAVSSYFVIALMVVVSAVLYRRVKAPTTQKAPNVFLALLLAALAVRAMWLLLRAGGVDADGASDVALRVANRVCMLLSFSAYSGYVLQWVLAVAPLQRASEGVVVSCSREKVTYAGAAVIGNALVWGISLVFVIAGIVASEEGESGNHWYNVDIVLIGVVALVLVAVFARYGWTLHRRLTEMRARSRGKAQSMRAVAHTDALEAARRKVAIATCACTVFWTIRAVMFLWRPLGGSPRFVEPWDAVLYPWCFYTWPEVVPGLTMVLLLVPKRTSLSAPSSSTAAASAADTAESVGGEPAGIDLAGAAQRSGAPPSTRM